jgi:hypothetical protein
MLCSAEFPLWLSGVIVFLPLLKWCWKLRLLYERNAVLLPEAQSAFWFDEMDLV